MRRALLLVIALAAACSPRPETYDQIAHAYLLSVSRDPIRTLPLLTDAFHRSHGLHVATASQARGEPTVAPSALAVDRYQLGWLSVQSRPELARLLAGMTLTFAEGNLGEEGDRAWVVVPIDPREGPAFEQRFSLVRAGPDAPWRIDSIEQSGVVAENAATAFALYPNEAARRALAQRKR